VEKGGNEGWVRTKDDDVFVVPIECVVPLGGVEHFAFEGVCAGDVALFGDRERTYSGY
jgi:hypothetical protein